MDRTYVRSRLPGRRAHAFVTWTRVPGRAIGACGVRVQDPEEADRLPPDWRLCGRCGRILAARSDVEEDTTYGVTVAG